MESIYKQEFEEIELFNEKGLFTNARVANGDVPEGLYKYDLREDGEGNFCEIEKTVKVNHGGTVLLKRPLDLGRDGYLTFNEETSPNFLGQTKTIKEYLKEEAEIETMEEIKQI